MIPENEIITGERFQALADITFITKNHNYIHTSCKNVNKIFYDDITQNVIFNFQQIVSIFIYASNQEIFKKIVLPKIKSPVILLVHNGDDTFDDLEIINHNLVIHVLAQNCPLEHEKITHVPIGLANEMWPHGNIETFYKILSTQNDTTKKEMLYVNFGTSTYPQLRKPLLDKIQNFPSDFILKETGKSFSEYITSMKNCKYVLSPRGNGLDTHRTWEALYLGCYVICDENELTVCFKKYDLDIFTFRETDIEDSLLEAQMNSENRKNSKWLLLSTYFDLINKLKSKKV